MQNVQKYYAGTGKSSITSLIQPGHAVTVKSASCLADEHMLVLESTGYRAYDARKMTTPDKQSQPVAVQFLGYRFGKKKIADCPYLGGQLQGNNE